MNARHQCPACGRDVAQYPGTYGTPEKVYVSLHPHKAPDGRWCPNTTAVVAVKLRAAR